jgi:hypothetical protein
MTSRIQLNEFKKTRDQKWKAEKLDIEILDLRRELQQLVFLTQKMMMILTNTNMMMMKKTQLKMMIGFQEIFGL